MADSEFGQLWAELELGNEVSPQLRQIIDDFKLVDNSVARTKKHLEEFSDVEVSKNTNQIEKNWRSVRGAVIEYKTEIDKLKSKLKELDDLGIGRETNAYRKYEEELKKLISLRNQLMRRERRGDIIGSDDVTRYKSELQLAKKEIANTDIQAKRLVDTQRQNVSIVEKMVAQYDRMATSLASTRQSALDSGMTKMGTQYLENTVQRIKTVADALRQALSNPASLTSNMVQQMTAQFDQLEARAKRQAESIRMQMSARMLFSDSEAAVATMETAVERLRNKLRGLKEDKKITVDTSELDRAKDKLEQFIIRYKQAISSPNFSKGEAKRLAEEYRILTEEARKASVVVDGFAQAQRRANTSDASNIRKTAEALQQTRAAFDPIIEKMQQLQSTTSRTGVIWEQFKTQIAFTAFSVYGLEHFLKSIITIGGEFERQRVALQNMLGDMREASEIFGQLKNLALESPFTFRQLSTYTKQLAAFSIPYEELYDTNRRLSDMSAGLGVDMSRLILAYGQVRAATVLRGQELRQFTEAGVPMVEKLADYFTKLNGELVTTRDIFTMISKKQVPFEAVRAVMQEMTDEGGMFYNMQAKIADTLSGRWGNLKDAWEILLGEIADGQSLAGSALKTFVEGITSVIRNLRTILGLLGGLASAKIMTGIGSTLSGAFVGKSSSEKQYIQAKRLVAADLQREAITRKLHSNEQAILMTKNRMTTLDYQALVRSGALDKYQMMILVKRRKITFEMAKQAMLNQGVYMSEIARLQNMSRMELMLRRMGVSLTSMLWNWNTAFMAIGAIVGAIIQHSQKIENIRENLSEQAKQSRIDIGGFLNDNPLKDDMDSAEAKRAIEKYEEELKKVAPNFLEIKSRIVGEHGESPQEQAQAYRDELQKFLDNSGDSDFVARTANELNDRGWIHDTVIEKANRYYRVMRDLRDEVTRLDPSKLVEMVGLMTNMDNATKAATISLIKHGKKLDALSMGARTWIIPKENMSREQQDYVDYIDALRTQLLGGSVSEGKFKDASNEFFEKIKEDIKNSYADSFDKQGRWIGDINLKESLLAGFRDFLSAAGADEGASKGLMAGFETSVFGASTSTAVDMLASAWVQKNQDLVAKFKKSGGEVTKEISESLNQQAHNIALTDFNFMQNLDYILNGRGMNEVIKRIRIQVGLDDSDLQAWQTQMIKDFNDNPDIAAVIKAQPDIPSAIEAIEKLHKESREKMAAMKPLMIQYGFQLVGYNPIDDKQLQPGSGVLLPQYQNQAAEQYNQQAAIEAAIEKNKVKYGIKDPKTKTPKKTGGGKKEDKELQSWQRHVELYKKFLDQYRELTKMWGEKKALDTLRDSKAYEWVVDFARGRGLDVTDIDAMNDALNSILDVNKGDKQKRKDAMAKRYADIESEGYKRQGDALKRLNDQLNEQLKILNEQYDAYQKIFTITGNKEGAMQLAFGGNVTNERYIDELTEQLRDALKATDWSGTIDQALDMTKEKVNEVFGEESEAANLINKTKEERNKLEKEYIDILANALTSDMSLEDKRAEAVRKYNEELRKLIELRGKATTEEAKAQAQAGIDALTRTNNRTVAGYDTKIYERDMNLGSMLNNLSGISTFMLTGIRDRLEIQRRRYEGDKTDEGIAEYNRLTDMINKITNAITERGGIFNMFKEAFSESNDDITIGANGRPIISGATAARYGLKEGQEVGFDTAERIKNAEKLRKLAGAIDKASKAFKDIETILKPVIDLFDALGMEDTPFGQAMTGTSNALSAAGSTAGAFNSLAQAAGPDSPIGSLLSKAGPYGAAAAAALSVATTIFQLHDKALQKEIEASEARQKEMENIADTLEKVLERTLGGIYTAGMDERTRQRFDDAVHARGGINSENVYYFGSLNKLLDVMEESKAYTKETLDAMEEALASGSYYDASYASLLAQRDELQRQLELEQQKKKKDDSAISDLKQQLIEMEDTLEYFAIDMAKKIYDIDIKSWANELAQTIVDAWAQGEDAVEAYKKKVKEMMRSLAVNIVAQKVLEPLLKPVEELVTSEMNAKNGQLDEYSIIRIGDMLMEQTDKGVSVITGILDRLRDAGWDLSDVEDNASTLGKGIASITEDTADLLASYINAIRADVAAMRALEERILEGGFADVNSNLALQLTELRNISAFAERNAVAAERILELFDSVTTVGSNGRKVKI